MLAVFTVDSIANEGPGTLRDAIEQANVSEESDEILFDAELFATPQTIAIDSTLPRISKPLSIIGPGADSLSIDGQHGTDRVAGTGDGWAALIITSPSGGEPTVVEISGLTVRNSDGGTLSNSGDLQISNSVFANNYATRGGAIYSEGPLRLIDSTVVDNQAQDGGGLYTRSFTEIIGSTISGNRAESGAAITARILNEQGIAIRNSTIVENTITDVSFRRFDESSVYILRNGSRSTFPITIENSIIAETRDKDGETLPDFRGSFGVPFELEEFFFVSHSLIGYFGEDLPERIVGVNGNVIGKSAASRISPRVAPLALNGGSVPTHALQHGSRALDAGDPSVVPQAGEFDQRGDAYARVADGGHGLRIDIGAYEAQGQPTSSPGDFNRDGHIDAADYTVWRDSFGETVTPLSGADADGDGVVNELDAQIWRSHFGEQYPAYPLVVNDLGDRDDGDINNGVTTLREAINFANNDPTLDRITFDPSLSGGTIFVGRDSGSRYYRSRYEIYTHLTIDATNLEEGILLLGEKRPFKGARSIFHVGRDPSAGEDGGVLVGRTADTDLTLAGLTMDGRAGFAGVVDFDSLGTLTMIESTIHGDPDSSPSIGGGIYSVGPVSLIDSTIEGTRAGIGGAIYSYSDVTLLRSEIRDTTADGSGRGGGIYTRALDSNGYKSPNTNVTLIDSSIVNSSGVGIYTDGDVTLIRSHVDNNYGAGIRSVGREYGSGQDAVHFGKVTLTDSSVSGNTAERGNRLDPYVPVSGGGAGIVAARDVSLLRSHVDNNRVLVGESEGGGIAAAGKVLLTDSTVNGNSAFWGGGISAYGLNEEGQFEPGTFAITVINSDVNNNTSSRGGGGLHAHSSISITGSKINGNRIPDEFDYYYEEAATAVYIPYGTSSPDTFIEIVDSEISHNQGHRSTVYLESIHVDVLRSTITDNSGDGVSARSVIDSTISRNGRNGVVGATFISGSTISRNGGIGVSGSELLITGSTISENSGGGVGASRTVTIIDSVIRDNTSTFRGAGILASDSRNSPKSVFLLRTLVEGNQTFQHEYLEDVGQGGGIYARELTAVASTIRNNATHSEGAKGGGIYAGRTHLYKTTVSGNDTYGDSAEGGGIYSEFDTFAIQSTLSGNRTLGAGSHGGGISTRIFEAKQSTITDNHAEAADANGGGVYFRESDYTLEGTIVAGNTAGADGNDWFATGTGTPTVNYSLIGDIHGSGIDASTGTGNRLNVDPRLGPLAANGGPTPTHALLPGSPALDAGDSLVDPDSLLPPPYWRLEDYTPVAGFDARLAPFARLADGGSGTVRIDIGAYEAQAAPQGMPGDYNLDGTVDLADFTLWRIGEGAVVSPLTVADGNGDGVVDLSDYRTWRTHYGHSFTPPVAAVALLQASDKADSTFQPPNPQVADEAFATNERELLLVPVLGDVVARDNDREQPMQQEQADTDEAIEGALDLVFAGL